MSGLISSRFHAGFPWAVILSALETANVGFMLVVPSPGWIFHVWFAVWARYHGRASGIILQGCFPCQPHWRRRQRWWGSKTKLQPEGTDVQHLMGRAVQLVQISFVSMIYVSSYHRNFRWFPLSIYFNRLTDSFGERWPQSRSFGGNCTSLLCCSLSSSSSRSNDVIVRCCLASNWSQHPSFWASSSSTLHNRASCKHTHVHVLLLF